MQSSKPLLLAIGLISATTAFASESVKLYQYVGSSPLAKNKHTFTIFTTSVACPASIDTRNSEYATVPASKNALYQSAIGGGLTPGKHTLSKVSVYVATKPGYVGLIACQYGDISPNYNYVIYQNTNNTVQYLPDGGAWVKKADDVGYDATCTSALDQCTFRASS